MRSQPISAKRRDRLRDLVQARGFASLGELAASLEVSESTIRRDLEQLEKDGHARRTHGGAFWTGDPDTMEVFQTRRDDSWPAKVAIGVAASSMIEDHDTILLDGGSTTYELARHLVQRPLQVVTNSLPVAHLLSASESIDLVMIGGCVRGRTAVTIGPMADTMLRSINVGKAFLSVAGITERGFFNSNMMLVESEKVMIEAADRTIVVADSSKFGKVSLSRLCGLQDVDTVVTDAGLQSEWKQHLEMADVELVLASKSEHKSTHLKTS
ncbi:DeoR/GlpR family DNA-binding transcription regulator [Rubripirellula lacrimiformis]|uniref:DeoR/GlpR family DNA-binding transcription regulator n=1 Tax=Rubripirellula lacrimiformis TaxID=1930273 RepID=UPI001FE7F435|nr:DeoR/GlpR family DNA-binding transcription regulator [Rubripirellula lacrimiformis]